ncbi:MAG: hypothetical protein Q4B28_05150 [bacterium]|nr:hypothetical protein [bacterium]
MKKKTERTPTTLPQFQYGDYVEIISDGTLKEGQGILPYFYAGQTGTVQNILQYPESECFGFEVELDTGKKVLMKEDELRKTSLKQ